MGDRFIRVDADVCFHRKTIELERILGCRSAGWFLICLWCWAAIFRPNGDLTGLGSKDIAAAARWDGDPDLFASALKSCGGSGPGFLEEADGRLFLHAWAEKQQFFADAEARQRERERKRDQREAKSAAEDKQKEPTPSASECPTDVPDNAGTLSRECPTLEKRRGEKRRSDPTTTPPTPQGECAGFDEFWRLYPKHIGKKAALKAWERLKPNAELHQRILTAIRAQRSWPQWTKDGGQYIPNPATWLNHARWEDEPTVGTQKWEPPEERLARGERGGLLDVWLPEGGDRERN